MVFQVIDPIQKYMSHWDKYKHLYDIDKDAYMRRYARHIERTLESFETDIADKMVC
jgi:hypothetical protein